MCIHLSTPDKIHPEPHIYLKHKVSANRVVLGPEEASVRVKGYALHLGAALVGITEIDPLWIYSHRGEIFHGNWDEWGRELEISRGDLLRLLGQGGHGLQRVHAGLPLEPCKNFP